MRINFSVVTPGPWPFMSRTWTAYTRRKPVISTFVYGFDIIDQLHRRVSKRKYQTPPPFLLWFSKPLAVEIWRESASEEMSFENVDDWRTTDACLYYKLTYEPNPNNLCDERTHGQYAPNNLPLTVNSHHVLFVERLLFLCFQRHKSIIPYQLIWSFKPLAQIVSRYLADKFKLPIFKSHNSGKIWFFFLI